MEKNILIIDNDSSITAILSFILNQSGYQTLIASSTKDILSSLNNKNHFLMVLMDLKTQKTNSINLLKKIMLLAPNLPVIAMTKTISAHELKNIYNSGFYGILYKPFDVEEVINIVNLIAKNKLVKQK